MSPLPAGEGARALRGMLLGASGDIGVSTAGAGLGCRTTARPAQTQAGLWAGQHALFKVGGSSLQLLLCHHWQHPQEPATRMHHKCAGMLRQRLLQTITKTRATCRS